MNPWYNDLAERLLLDGQWECSLNDTIGTLNIPGTWEAHGFPYRLDGPAYLRKIILVPHDWQGKRIQLQFDAVSYSAEVSVNGIKVGEHAGMWTSFALDVTDCILPGQKNEISLTVYKPGEHFPVRQSLAGFLPDVSIPFGGIWQSARLIAVDGPCLSDISLLSDVNSSSVQLKVEVHRAAGLTAVIRLLTPDGQEIQTSQSAVEADSLEFNLKVADPDLWSPDHPARYAIIIELRSGEMVKALVKRRFGFRTLMHTGDRVLLNGTSVCLRGVLNWGWYPEILCPNPDESTIRDEFRRVRDLGYNLIKLCLYVPAPRYFEMADEEGMLLWLELPMWLPDVTPRLRQQAPVEYRDILASVHMHPSVVIYSLGCELDNAVDAEMLSQLNELLRDRTTGVLACDNSGSGEAYGGLGFDYADFNDYHFYCDIHYFNPLVDHFRRDWRPARPWIFGEFCDADDFRDLDELTEAYGGALPWWLTEQNPIHPLSKLAYPLQQERMHQLDLPFDGQTLQRISRQQSFVIRKNILEKVRSRVGMGGYVVTGMRDTPLATSSMFDDLQRMKYPPDTFRMFNAETVLTLEQGRARHWTCGGDRPFPVDRYNHVSGAETSIRVILSHTGAPISNDDLRWQLQLTDGTTHVEGKIPFLGSLSDGHPSELGSIQLQLPVVTTAQEVMLKVQLGDHIRNEWLLWIYPIVATWESALAVYDPDGSLRGLEDLLEAADSIPDVSRLQDSHLLITNSLTPDVQDFVHTGGKAILLQSGPGFLPADPCPFWREGIKLFYPHPVLDVFPHQGFANMQFYHLATDYAFNLDHRKTVMPTFTAMRPILRRLDARLFTLHDYLVELKLGQGTLLASTLHFTGGAGDQVIGFQANVAGRFLIQQMIGYLRAL